ncbi:hypothetical protein P7C73_g4170, partial [Tremellales sp. Uapishka_1]
MPPLWKALSEGQLSDLMLPLQKVQVDLGRVILCCEDAYCKPFTENRKALIDAISLFLKDYAYDEEQKYKEGRFILERDLVIEKPENKRDQGKPRIEEIPVPLQMREMASIFRDAHGKRMNLKPHPSRNDTAKNLYHAHAVSSAIAIALALALALARRPRFALSKGETYLQWSVGLLVYRACFLIVMPRHFPSLLPIASPAAATSSSIPIAKPRAATATRYARPVSLLSSRQAPNAARDPAACSLRPAGSGSALPDPDLGDGTKTSSRLLAGPSDRIHPDETKTGHTSVCPPGSSSCRAVPLRGGIPARPATELPGDSLILFESSLGPDDVQLQILSDVFERTTYPSTGERDDLAKRLGMTSRSVQIWFQNKRRAVKVEQISARQRAEAAAKGPPYLLSPPRPWSVDREHEVKREPSSPRNRSG